MATFLIILEALSALPKIGALIQSLVMAISGWWGKKQAIEKRIAIENAAAEVRKVRDMDPAVIPPEVRKKAKRNAAKKWREAISK